MNRKKTVYFSRKFFLHRIPAINKKTKTVCMQKCLTAVSCLRNSHGKFRIRPARLSRWKKILFSPVKGVLVNTEEPGETDFAEDRDNQWLLCAEQTYTEHTHGIKVINLLDDYVPFPCSAKLPYKQYISAYKGKISEKEAWLSELSELIRSDKHYIKNILRDRKPDSRYRMEHDKKRLAYVRELTTE